MPRDQATGKFSVTNAIDPRAMRQVLGVARSVRPAMQRNAVSIVRPEGPEALLRGASVGPDRRIVVPRGLRDPASVALHEIGHLIRRPKSGARLPSGIDATPDVRDVFNTLKTERIANRSAVGLIPRGGLRADYRKAVQPGLSSYKTGAANAVAASMGLPTHDPAGIGAHLARAWQQGASRDDIAKIGEAAKKKLVPGYARGKVVASTLAQSELKKNFAIEFARTSDKPPLFRKAIRVAIGVAGGAAAGSLAGLAAHERISSRPHVAGEDLLGRKLSTSLSPTKGLKHHVGIAVENDAVVHPGRPPWESPLRGTFINVREPLARFSGGSPIRVSRSSDKMSPAELKGVAQRANASVTKSGRYDACKGNCEHEVNRIVKGRSYSGQVRSATAGAVVGGLSGGLLVRKIDKDSEETKKKRNLERRAVREILFARKPLLEDLTARAVRSIPTPELPGTETIRTIRSHPTIARRIVKIAIGAGTGAFVGQRLAGRHGAAAGISAGTLAGMIV